MVKKNIDVHQQLTMEQEKMLQEAKMKKIEFDNDSPELTDEELKAFARVATEFERNSQKQTVTLRLSPRTLEKAKALGKGYTSILSRIIENALKDPETLSKSLNG